MSVPPMASLSPSRHPKITSLSHAHVQQSYSSRNAELHLDEETSELYEVEECSPSSPLIEEVDLTCNLQQRSTMMKRKSASPHKPTRASPPMSDLRDNVNLTKAVDNLHAEHDKENQQAPNSQVGKSAACDPDDTCVSTFSMVPTADMTRFAQRSMSPSKPSPRTSPTRGSPSKGAANSNSALTPRSSQPGTPRKAHRRASGHEVSPTPQRSRQAGSDEMTTQLLDFTEQLNYAPLHSPSRRVAAFRSPARNENANLLDFDLPPAPTPRSLPTITRRELESLKSGFLSQISSLKATIDGQEATIKSLVDAKDDAERRVGDTAEMLRETHDAKKALEDEKEEWAKRDAEIHKILMDVKCELVDRKRENKELSSQLEAAQVWARDASAELAVEKDKATQQHSAPDGTSEVQKTPRGNKNIDQVVEDVTRELHALYKSKHEAKIAQLKKAYERRWERTLRELEGRIDELTKENEELRVGRDGTMTREMPSMVARGVAVDASNQTESANLVLDAPAAGEEDGATSCAQPEGQIAELTELVRSLEATSEAAWQDASRLRMELESSRAENSNLVSAVEEMLQLEPAAGAEGEEVMAENDALPTPLPPRPASQARTRSDSMNESFRASGSEHSAARGSGGPKASGLAKSGFGFGGSRIGTLTRSASGGQGSSSRSGVMSNIEKMGRGRAAE